MTAKMILPVKRGRSQTSLTVCLLCVLAGLSLAAAGLAVAVEFSQSEIHLRKDSGAVSGSVRWRLAGVPIFWRSLDGLAQVDREDYQVRDNGNGGSNRPLKNVARVVFRSDAGLQLAWAERTALVNEVEPLQRFLRNDAMIIEADADGVSRTTYRFIEPTVGTTWDRVQAGMMAAVFITILALAGILCLLAGILSLCRRIQPSLRG